MPLDLFEEAKYSESIGSIGSHSHNCYEILFVKEGKLELKIDSKSYIVEAPSLIFISKLEMHHINVLSQKYHRYFLCIDSNMVSTLIGNHSTLSILTNRPVDFCHVLDASQFEKEVDRIFSVAVSEQEEKGAFYTQRQAAAISELLVLVYRHAPQLFSNENEKSISIIWKIRSRIEGNCREQISLSQLAEEYHMSVCYLSHLFKKITGYSVIQYLNMCRLSLARQLLADTELSITEIVYAAGFSDTSNFSRLFKRETGLSPIKYRRKEKNEQ
ncbi:MAG: helix-turn-helix transcriptional regulator [Clostridia bacterium]|nr:helix-turn-helix transcriptional regulator [Clostridia bacterium]